MSTVAKLSHEADSKTQSTSQEKQYLQVSWDNCISEARAADIPTRLHEKLTDQKINEWNRTIDQANRLAQQISFVHQMMKDNNQKPFQYRSAYKTLWSQYRDVIASLRELDSEVIDRFRSKVVARVKEQEARIKDLCDNWDPDYSDYFERTLACYEKNYDLMLALDEEAALSNAREVARHTEELLASRGWCLWKCQALNGDYILVVDDFAEPGDYPEGYPVYTMSEITVLFGGDKPASKWTLTMVHEAKKLAGAEVTDRITKTREQATDEETGARV